MLENLSGFPLTNRRHLLDTHRCQRLFNRTDDIAHFVRIDRADAADAECFDLRQLARIEDEAASRVIS